MYEEKPGVTKVLRLALALAMQLAAGEAGGLEKEFPTICFTERAISAAALHHANSWGNRRGLLEDCALRRRINVRNLRVSVDGADRCGTGASCRCR